MKAEEKNLQEVWDNIKSVFYCQNLMYVPEIIYFKIIICHYNDPLAG